MVDPVGELSLASHGEASDRSDERAVGIDREQRAVRVIANALVVPIERNAIGGIGPCDCRHRDSAGISLPLEEPI
jgi:hypothetical protein